MPKLEMERLAGRTSVINGPTNIGVVESGKGEAVLIDAGNDEDGGRKILRACEASGLRIVCIANTHSNADHCGGNAFIQARTDCRIAATRAEAAFIETPVLEPSLLWGGYPVPPLRNKFLMPQPSRVTDILRPPCELPGCDVKAVPLPGHFLAMTGFMTADRVFFAADSLASAEILAKYHVFYLFDIAAHLETLDSLPALDADWVVPSHAPPTRDVRPLVEINKAKTLEIGAFLFEACAEPASPERLLSLLAGHYGIVLNHTQYVLLGSTVRSYLAWLVDKKDLASRMEDGYMLFERA